MHASDLQGTNIDKNRGRDEFAEVEELIRETLAESKKSTKEETPVPKPVPERDFKATTISLPQPDKPAPATNQLATKQTTPPLPTEAAKYEATFKEYQPGDIVKGTVIKVDPGGVLVDIKYKADGLIPPEELLAKSFSTPDEVVKVGDKIDVLIDNLENKEGYVMLSQKRAADEVRWKTTFDAYYGKKVLEGKVLQVLRGGLVVDCVGLRGFVPASQVAKAAEEGLEKFQDQVLPFKVIEINRRQGKVVLSHKLGSKDQDKLTTSKVFDEIEVGQIRKGKVANLKSFGAFVDLGGVEGLIHLSELSWKRVKHPSELLKSGEEIEVFVLGVDRVNKKISLGLKELQPDPWENAGKYYKPGQIVQAKVLRFAKFGAFVELEHGLEGLIHNTELAKAPVYNPSDAVKIGAVVDVKVLRVLPEEQKIGLSIKEVLLQREKEEAKKVASVGDEQKVTIKDMIVQKEKERAAQAAAEEVVEEEAEAA